jgi:hypothetical protein
MTDSRFVKGYFQLKIIIILLHINPITAILYL